MIKKKFKSLDKYLFLFLILNILIFGRHFVYLKFSIFPGYISDYIILMILFLNIFKLKRVINNKNLIFLISYLLIISFRNIDLANLPKVEEIGQDLLFVIYPILIYLIFQFFDFQHHSHSINKFLILLTCIYVIDYFLERIYLISFFHININNVFYLNISHLKVVEITLFLTFIYLFLTNKEVNKNLTIFLLIGINFGFLSTQSKTTVIVFILLIAYTILLLLKNNLIRYNFMFLILGFFISFIFTFQFDEKKANEFLNYLNSNNIESNLGINKLRYHSFECFVAQLKPNYENSSCEYILDEFNDSDILKLEELIKIKNENYLQLENYEKSKFLVNLQNEKCGNSIKWRLELVNAGNKIIFQNLQNILFGVNIGSEIPKLLIEKKLLEPICYYESIFNERPLRNLHSTFITIAFRMGYFTLIVLALNFQKLYSIKPNLFNVMLIILTSVLTNSDPLLDGPIASIPFWSILAYQNITKYYSYHE